MLITLNKKLGVYNFNLPAGQTCQRKCSYCYAAKHRWILPVVKNKLAQNYESSLSDNFTDTIIEEIKNKKLSLFRWHSSGDGYSIDYWKKVITVMNALPNVTFFTYTKAYLNDSLLPILWEVYQKKNMYLWLSMDSANIDSTMHLAKRYTKIYNQFPFKRVVFVDKNYSNCGKQVSKGTNCITCGKCFSQNENFIIFKLH